jgi:uncharacterized membrane protein
MNSSARRLSRPVYESLPWGYLGLGVIALASSYFWVKSVFWSTALVLLGIAAVLAGLVVLLRRRDFRDRHQRDPE